MAKTEAGSAGFSKDYWDKNYSEPYEMDNIGNVREHCRYIQSIFHLEQVEINSIADLGFGLGYLFQELMNTFHPYRAFGIEPSAHAFSEAKTKFIPPSEVKKFKISNTDIVSWGKNLKGNEKVLDLGVCTSVFQYLKDDEIRFILPILSAQFKYLYFSCPTESEFKRQKEEYDFVDEYAIHRKKEKYLKWISPHFTFVSSRLLESKVHFNENTTEFRELLFRF